MEVEIQISYFSLWQRTEGNRGFKLWHVTVIDLWIWMHEWDKCGTLVNYKKYCTNIMSFRKDFPPSFLAGQNWKLTHDPECLTTTLQHPQMNHVYYKYVQHMLCWMSFPESWTRGNFRNWVLDLYTFFKRERPKSHNYDAVLDHLNFFK